MRTWPVVMGLSAILAIVWTARHDWLQVGEPTIANEYTILALGVPLLVTLAARTLQKQQEARSLTHSRRPGSRSE